jgi:hypothetical protein
VVLFTTLCLTAGARNLTADPGRPSFELSDQFGVAHRSAQLADRPVLLIGGQVVPPVLLGLGLLVPGSVTLAYGFVGTLLVFGTRLVLRARFRQSWLGAALHPIGIGIVVAIQWFALSRSVAGRPLAWKGRS